MFFLGSATPELGPPVSWIWRNLRHRTAYSQLRTKREATVLVDVHRSNLMERRAFVPMLQEYHRPSHRGLIGMMVFIETAPFKCECEGGTHDRMP